MCVGSLLHGLGLLRLNLKVFDALGKHIGYSVPQLILGTGRCFTHTLIYADVSRLAVYVCLPLDCASAVFAVEQPCVRIAELTLFFDRRVRPFYSLHAIPKFDVNQRLVLAVID